MNLEVISPPSKFHNKQLWWKRCRKIRALAQRIVTGEVGIIEGSRQMLGYQSWLQLHDDEDFQPFHDLDEKTYNHPVGKVRDHWSADALKKKDQEAKYFEDVSRDRVIEAVAKIRQKFEIATKHKHEK